MYKVNDVEYGLPHTACVDERETFLVVNIFEFYYSIPMQVIRKLKERRKDLFWRETHLDDDKEAAVPFFLGKHLKTRDRTSLYEPVHLTKHVDYVLSKTDPTTSDKLINV